MSATFKSKVSTIAFYLIVFYAAVAQGGYFTVSLIILNLFFLIMLLRQKEIMLDFNAMAFLAVFAVMVLSSILLSHSPYAAINELLKYLLCFTSYLFFANKTEDKAKFEKIFFHGFILIMAFGLLGMAGLSPIAHMVTEIGGRLQSFLQYANTTALLMGIGVFYCTHLFIRDKKKHYIIPAVLFFAAIIFTNSRVSFIVFLLAYAAYLFRFVSWKIKGGLLAVAAILGTFLVITDSRLARISIFEPTLVERYISYFDAVSMLSFRPLGIGVGNWQFESLFYQSAPYQVRYIHNFYLQIALDGGLIPLILMLAVFIVTAIKMKRDTVYFYIGLFVLATAFWEIHFNFGLVIIYFSFLLAITGGEALKKYKLPNTKLKYIAIVPIFLLSAFLMSEYNIQRGEALEQSRNHQAAHAAYRRAHALNPLNETIYFRYARIERNIGRAIDYLERAYAINPWNISVITALSEGHLFAGDFETSFYYADRLFTIFPYSIPNQRFVRAVIDRGYEDGLIDEGRHHALHIDLEQRIARKNAEINPLFRFINENMEYYSHWD